MSLSLFGRPILNSPYDYPVRHWELDESGQPTNRVIERRPAQYVSPIPKPKKGRAEPAELDLADASGPSTARQKYDPTPVINTLRQSVDAWRALSSLNDWAVTPETARLLAHWLRHKFGDLRPFFYQVETIIWLVELAPKLDAEGRRFLDHLSAANEEANPGLARLALKLGTGAGKKTVMAMLIALRVG